MKLSEVPVREVRVSEEIAEHIRRRDERYSNALGVSLAAVIEAVSDQRRVVARWSPSKAGEALALVGYSSIADRLVLCLIVPDEHPPVSGVWHLATAWYAGRREAMSYHAREGELMRDPKELRAIAEEAERYREEHPDEELAGAVPSTDAIPVQVVLSVRVDGSLAERLAVAANRVGVSVSELVRTWLTERIEVERTHVDRLRIANDLEQIARLVRAGM